MPTTFCPKLNELELSVSVPFTLTPVPESATVFGELLAELLMVSVPVIVPVTVGANATEICALCHPE
jgi:hypothetical protein